MQGVPVLAGWLVVDETTKVQNGKRQTIYTWDARSSKDCIKDLVTLCEDLQVGLDTRFNDIIPNSVKQLEKIFDIERMVENLCKFSVQDGNLVISRRDRIEWEADGSNEFREFYQHVCDIPHVQKLADEDHDLDLLPHDSSTILKRLKTTMQKMFWQRLGNCTDAMFLDEEGKAIVEFKQSNLVAASPMLSENSLDRWFELYFASGALLKARLNEEHIIAEFYKNQSIYESLGQEMCIALDVALSAGGCEAVVEGFYSVISAHKKDGGQSNNILMQRAIVDWSLPNPISCPKTMEEIAQLYTNGDKKRRIARHQAPLFSDVRGRAASRYDVSKVVDRLRTESPKCPHIVMADFPDE